MRAVLVCVDYADLLAVTLPYNRHHFSDVLVITTPEDTATRRVCEAFPFKVDLCLTRSFYLDGARFNKWRALEEGLDLYGRHGWLCLMDADVLWPRCVQWDRVFEAELYWLAVGHLFTPLRRMAPWPGPVPPESSWRRFPLHRNLAEWAGYSQIFHADDPHLGPPPWHETDWAHAGGADSIFQRKWPVSCKVRPPFEVLHLGPAGENWCGRATPYADGTLPEGALEKRQQVRRYIQGRAKCPPDDRYRGEKLR